MSIWIILFPGYTYYENNKLIGSGSAIVLWKQCNLSLLSYQL